MATNFPASLDSLTNPTSSDSLASPSHASQHANVNDAVEALQAKVGVDGSAVTSSLDYKVANLGTWQTFTPTWTAQTTNPSIGNGILNGRYVQINKLVIAQYDLKMGSTTTYGSGVWYLTFPVAADFTSMFAYMDLGTGRMFDASAGTVYGLHIIGDNASSTSFRLVGNGAPNNIESTVPFAWASGDEAFFTLWYRAA